MSELSINLNYHGPVDDFRRSVSLNPDESMNVKYSLLAYKNLLSQNLETIEKLIENVDKLEGIYSYYNQLMVLVKEKDDGNQLIDQGILNRIETDAETDANTETTESYYQEESETNWDRRQTINKLINLDRTLDDSESESELDEIFDDENMTVASINKLKAIQSRYLDDEESD